MHFLCDRCCATMSINMNCLHLYLNSFMREMLVMTELLACSPFAHQNWYLSPQTVSGTCTLQPCLTTTVTPLRQGLRYWFGFFFFLVNLFPPPPPTSLYETLQNNVVTLVINFIKVVVFHRQLCRIIPLVLLKGYSSIL